MHNGEDQDLKIICFSCSYANCTTVVKNQPFVQEQAEVEEEIEVVEELEIVELASNAQRGDFLNLKISRLGPFSINIWKKKQAKKVFEVYLSFPIAKRKKKQIFC
jgi:hypothetical protein